MGIGHISQRICSCGKKFNLQGAWKYCQACREKYGLSKANQEVQK
jgi:hypothetical protein